jgi:hypothetical protein
VNSPERLLDALSGGHRGVGRKAERRSPFHPPPASDGGLQSATVLPESLLCRRIEGGEEYGGVTQVGLGLDRRDREERQPAVVIADALESRCDHLKEQRVDPCRARVGVHWPTGA